MARRGHRLHPEGARARAEQRRRAAKAFNPSSSGAPRYFRDGESEVFRQCHLFGKAGRTGEPARAPRRRRSVSQITLPDDLVPASAQCRLRRQQGRWRNGSAGSRSAGRSPAPPDAMCGKLQLDGPIDGRTFRRFACTSLARFKAAELLDPLIECKFFVTLGARPAAAGRAVDALLKPSRRSPRFTQASRWRSAAIRERPCRRCQAILADGSASGRYVFGDRIETVARGTCVRCWSGSKSMGPCGARVPGPT